MHSTHIQNEHPKRYRHYKGAIYETIGQALHTETEEQLIIYYAVNKPEQLFARPTAMFFETVDIDGKILPRFEPLAS